MDNLEVNKSRPRLDIVARCACGGVAVTVQGTAQAMLLCACEDCQKSSGTGHSTVVLVEANDFSVTGELSEYARPADSGATLTRHFCPTCGTPIYASSSRAFRMVMLPVGLFGADAAWFRPSQLIFARTHRDWDVIPDHLPRHERYRNSGKA